MTNTEKHDNSKEITEVVQLDIDLSNNQNSTDLDKLESMDNQKIKKSNFTSEISTNFSSSKETEFLILKSQMMQEKNTNLLKDCRPETLDQKKPLDPKETIIAGNKSPVNLKKQEINSTSFKLPTINRKFHTMSLIIWVVLTN